jgi:PhnB protein
MTQVIRPKLVLDDARSALEWYAAALGATTGEVHEHDGTIVHADLVVLGTHLSLKDADEVDPSAASQGVTGQILEVLVEDPDPIFAAMLERGAEVVFPLDDQDYGARAGRVKDPYGVQWLVTTPVS